MLVDAGIALSSELSLDALLQRLVEAAAELTGAQYAALGVIDTSGRELERFVTTGVDPETYSAIGEAGDTAASESLKIPADVVKTFGAVWVMVLEMPPADVSDAVSPVLVKVCTRDRAASNR